MGSDEGQHALESYLEQIERATDGGELVNLEANAAKHYWNEWRELEVRFSKPATVPEHWKTFGGRGSPYAAGNQHAVTTSNAILNYLYAILQAETRIACLSLGLDPTLGIFHPTQRWRDSFVFDLIEPARPVVDDFVPDLLEDRVFEKAEFFENRKGVVRLLPPLSHELSETASRWKSVVGTIAQHFARALIEVGGSGSRGGLARTRGSTLRGQVIPALLAQREQLDDKRSAGDRKRRRTIQKRWARNQQWDRAAQEPVPEDLDFEEEILPGLQEVKIREIAESTGLSMSYSSAIRSGKYVPHRRHWKALANLGGL